jgi:hypothetical protein
MYAMAVFATVLSPPILTQLSSTASFLLHHVPCNQTAYVETGGLETVPTYAGLDYRLCMPENILKGNGSFYLEGTEGARGNWNLA